MCMLNGKTKFHVPNVPEDIVPLRYNITFTYVFDAVKGKAWSISRSIRARNRQ